MECSVENIPSDHPIMPLIHERTFHVRHYECDRYRHVNNAVYLRYMQEAAFEASAAAGYDFARYQQLRQHWLVRETEIEYLRPLVYGDSVRVKTWVADFRQVRSRRMYELYNAATHELAARASTDWVFVDAATLAPAKIPPELIAAFFPEGAPPPAPRREPFPEPPPPPPGVFTLRRRVRWSDLDPAQHVNNANYVAYIEDCAIQMSEHFGWPFQRFDTVGIAIIPRQHRIEYLQAAVLDDEVDVATWAYDRKRATVTRHYRLTRVSDGALLARVNTLYVWVDRVTLKPVRIPDLIADFAPNFVSPTT